MAFVGKTTQKLHQYAKTITCGKKTTQYIRKPGSIKQKYNKLIQVNKVDHNRSLTQ